MLVFKMKTIEVAEETGYKTDKHWKMAVIGSVILHCLLWNISWPEKDQKIWLEKGKIL